MSSTLPRVGDVVDVVYPWRSPRRPFRNDPRPCLVVLVDDPLAFEAVVGLCPMTSTAPDETERAISLPRHVRASLGLGDASCWVITSELVTLMWQTTGVHLSTTRDDRRGTMPVELTKAVRQALLRNRLDGKLRAVQQEL